MIQIKKKMTKGATYRVISDKFMSNHRRRCNCQCPNLVTNLIEGDIAWTRVLFECGEMVKISCLNLADVE